MRVTIFHLIFVYGNMLVFSLKLKFSDFHWNTVDPGIPVHHYRPQTKLREGNVFTHVCLSTGVCGVEGVWCWEVWQSVSAQGGTYRGVVHSPRQY